MWIVYLFDGIDVSPFNADLKFFTVWGEYKIQEEAIQVRNDLIRDGNHAKIVWQPVQISNPA